MQVVTLVAPICGEGGDGAAGGGCGGDEVWDLGGGGEYD